MKVYIVYEDDVFDNGDEYDYQHDYYIEDIFDSEDKAINFIQEEISKEIHRSECVFDDIPSEDYIRKHHDEIKYSHYGAYTHSYSYVEFEVH